MIEMLLFKLGGVSQVARWSEPGGRVKECFAGDPTRLPWWHPPRLPPSLHHRMALRVIIPPPSFTFLKQLQNVIIIN